MTSLTFPETFLYPSLSLSLPLSTNGESLARIGGTGTNATTRSAVRRFLQKLPSSTASCADILTVASVWCTNEDWERTRSQVLRVSSAPCVIDALKMAAFRSRSVICSVTRKPSRATDGSGSHVRVTCRTAIHQVFRVLLPRIPVK